MQTQLLRKSGIRDTRKKSAGSVARSRLRRRARQLHPFFEALACGLQGQKVNGLAFRIATLSNDARCFQFREANEHADSSHEQAPADPSVCEQVRDRLEALLSPADVDLLYLRFVAGWSQADVAVQRGCNRSTIHRREKDMLKVLRDDPVLCSLAGVPVAAEDGSCNTMRLFMDGLLDPVVV